MENKFFRSKFDKIREAYFTHDNFVISDDLKFESKQIYLETTTSIVPNLGKDIRMRRRLARTRSHALLKAIKCRKHRTCARIEAIKSTSAARDSIYEQRLSSNLKISNRRLQELIFECLGEYEKARGRASRRSSHLSSSIDQKLTERVDEHEWSIFLSKIEDECPNFRFNTISKTIPKFTELTLFFDEISINREEIRSKGLPRISHIVQITHKSGRAPRKRRENMNILSKLISSDSNPGRNLAEMLSSIGSKPSPEEFGASQGFKGTMLLTARPLSWLLLSPPQFLLDTREGLLWKNLRLANCRVYFHIEERGLFRDSRSAPTSETVVDKVTDLYYVPKSKTLSEGLLRVSGGLHRHRSDSHSADYPDVLVHTSKDDDDHHFAAATVDQLMESNAFTDRKKGHDMCVEHFYVAVRLKHETSLGVHLIALPRELIRVLIATFITNSTIATPTASAIIPASVSQSDSYFCLVRNPSFQPQTSTEELIDEMTPMPYAFLFQFSCENGEEDEACPSSTGKTTSKSQWDPTILWSYCRWRSCLCPATNSPAPKYLCTHHSMLKNLLDSTSKKKNESSRFLPRKPPLCHEAELGTTKRDLMLIKAASSLVEELVDNKLAATIESFCHRMSSEHGLLRQRHCSKFNLKEGNRESSWKRWGAPGVLEQTLSEMEQNSRAASASFALEHATTLEIQNLVNRGIYPVAEIALIQKELKNEVDLFDVESSQRKFELISSLVHHVKN